MELMPPEDDETYVKHVSLIVVGWVTATFIVAMGLALIVLLLV
jgi:hypothetical protein